MRRPAWDHRPEIYAVGASPGLPIAATGAPWNPIGARERLLDASGIGTGAPDYLAVRAAFLVIDTANPDERSAYDMPIGDIIDGRLVAHPEAIAQARRDLLSHRRADLDTLAQAQKIIDHYTRRFERRAVQTAAIGDEDDDGAKERARRAKKLREEFLAARP